ncbi:FAD binding domain-containing protein [Bacillus sp. Marseille-P3800]|uniref:FAD binding domain-containing protein n=1 Tax=Bacillus sp. Marseille-P3800 TaxID=2014782 RepID=UPI000C072950|nr:FAD binding domain-containing protein [Bacillus sp. Marseille-P3800]
MTNAEGVTTVVFTPISIEDAVKIKSETEDSTYIAGGTLLQLQREQGIPLSAHLISLEKIHDIHTIEERDTHIFIGAGMTLSQCIASSIAQDDLPLFVEALQTIAAPAVRNRATIGGNMAYAMGDMHVVFLSMNAQVVTFDVNSGYQEHSYETWIEDGPSAGLIIGVTIPKGKQEHSFYKKVGYRQSFTLSALTVAFNLTLTKAGTVEEVIVAVSGAMLPPRRLKQSEETLQGQRVSQEVVRQMDKQVNEEFSTFLLKHDEFPYQQRVAANVITAHLTSIEEENRYDKTTYKA